MRKSIIVLGLLSVGYAYSQSGPDYGHQARVGINTQTPKATFHIEKRTVATDDKRPQGVIFPHVSTTDRNAFVGTVEKGTMIYNTTENCIDLYDGTKWSCITTKATAGSGGSGGVGGGGSSSGIMGEIIGNVVLAKQTHYIASVKDTEYLPFTQPTALATWEEGETTGDDQLIDVQSVITTQGFDIHIPMTVTGSGAIGSYKKEITVTAEKSKNGQPGVLILEWDAQLVSTSTKYIVAKLRAKDNDFYIKQLDLAKGMGSDLKGVELAKFTYKKDNTNSVEESFTVRAISGIPDKNFGKVTPGTTKYEHDFLYHPMLGPDGRIWLNNNLGAEYARVDNTNLYFNPAHQAGARDRDGKLLTYPTTEQIKKDFRAYGYLYDYGRDIDGHEVMKWTDRNALTIVNRRIFDQRPTNRVYSSANDPCPIGFRIPLASEIINLSNVLLTMGVPRQVFINERSLKLPLMGALTQNGGLLSSISGGSSHYASISERDNDRFGALILSKTHTWFPDQNNHTDFIHAVRCIAD